MLTSGEKLALALQAKAAGHERMPLTMRAQLMALEADRSWEFSPTSLYAEWLFSRIRKWPGGYWHALKAEGCRDAQGTASAQQLPAS